MNKKVKIAVITASAALIVTINSMGVLAATPVPSKSNGNMATQAATQAPSNNTSATEKATSKPTVAATAKATSKPKETEKATSKPKATTSATVKPTATADPSGEPLESPTIAPTDGTTENTNPLVFSEETDKSIVSTVDEAAAADGRYTTKGGSFGWFILSIIINAVISFIIGNRFYKMSRRDTHVLAEIRAIKKDIDAKMQYNIGGFSEYETVINNSNKSYAKDESGIKSGEEAKAEELATEIYKKWENQVMAAKEREMSRKTAELKKTQTSSGRSRSRTIQKRNNSGLSGKVKDFINDVFPFDKD